VLIADCTFTDNESADRGGAIVLFESTSRIRDCSFIDNIGYHGGAIAIYDHASPEISSCVFIRNVATNGRGGAIFVRSADASIHNNTFFRNTAESGSAIYLDFDPSPANVYSDSNIFAENTADENYSTIFFYQSNLSSNCDGFHRNIGNPIDGIAASPEINRMLDLPWETDPGFCDAEAEDLHITTGSPFNDAE
jgi:predicted outer membrane repeat protein